jgi:uncharacterized lipoprotein YmbA
MSSPLQVQYHRLNVSTIQPSAPAHSLPIILVGPIRVSSFLGQGPLVTQQSQQSSTLLEQHHWAGNLDEMLSRLIIQNLILDLDHEHIYAYPAPSGTAGIRLEVAFFHFERDTMGNAFLKARWKIIRNSDQSIIYSATSTHTISPEDSGYDALAAGLSQALAELCQEITNQITQIQ